MVYLPAVCDRCDTIFKSSYATNLGATMFMEGCKSGPCPNCGSMGSVPDGTYKSTENILEILSAPEHSLNDLKRFQKLLNKTKSKEINIKQLEYTTKRELPSLRPLLEYIVPKSRKEKFQIGVVIVSTALQLFTNAISNGESTEKINADVVINKIYNIENHYYNDTDNYKVNYNQSSNVSKIEIKEPCPCGSGLEYKMCHGN